MHKMIYVVLLMLASGAAATDEPDIETQCLDCHRPSQRRGEVPLIEGQHREYLEHQLIRFRERHRQSFPMSAVAGGINDASAGRLASVLAERPWRDANVPGDGAAIRRGAAAAARRDCGSCHGPDFVGAGDIARLAGQHPGYLARQIEGFGRGDRYHPPSGTGAPMRNIHAPEAHDLAAFFSGFPPPSSGASDDFKE